MTKGDDKNPSLAQVIKSAKAVVEDIGDDADRNAPGVPPRAFGLAAAFCLVTSIAVALVVGAVAPAALFWPAALIGLVAALPTTYMAGWGFFVSGHVHANRKIRDEDIIEVKWIERAASGVFFDVVVLAAWGSLVLWLASTHLLAHPIVVSASGMLLAVAGFAVVSFVFRFLIARRQDVA
ncbi:hypothetical protein [Microbacterium sp.]|uniref:hypothetical protein n=1 Tax=Microbacterium sp. TaxID=51671 RepID=UPI0039E490EC